MWESMKAAGAASTACENHAAPPSWGSFGKYPQLKSSMTVHLSVQIINNDRPISFLAVWAYVVPSDTMQHDVRYWNEAVGWVLYRRDWSTLVFSASSRYRTRVSAAP